MIETWSPRHQTEGPWEVARRYLALDLGRLGAWSRQLVLAFQGVGTLAAGDTKPSVSGRRLWKTANTGATTITELRDGTSGQEIVLWFTDANTTLQHGANLKLVGGVNYTGAAGKTLLLATADGTEWREVPLR